jgi:hypothetical protein
VPFSLLNLGRVGRRFCDAVVWAFAKQASAAKKKASRVGVLAFTASLCKIDEITGDREACFHGGGRPNFR